MDKNWLRGPGQVLLLRDSTMYLRIEGMERIDDITIRAIREAKIQAAKVRISLRSD